MKSGQIRSYFWSVFSCIRTEYGDLQVNLQIQSNTEKYGPKKKKNSILGHFSRSARFSSEKMLHLKCFNTDQLIFSKTLDKVLTVPQNKK